MAALPSQGLVTGIDHYENFPVASVLVPARIRPAVLALYRFARYADDLADEGDASAAERLAGLDRLAEALTEPPRGTHPITDDLRQAFARQGVEVAPCLALLSAFRQDVSVTRYPDDAALLDYCTRSANPVGRMLLALFGCSSTRTLPLSDAICTALQLINFLQDVAADWRRGRLYLPLDALHAAGVSVADVEAAVEAGVSPSALRRCIEARAGQADALLTYGAPLVSLVPLRLGLELRATLAGAGRILEKLTQGGFDPIARRPVLAWQDAPALARLMLRRHPVRRPRETLPR